MCALMSDCVSPGNWLVVGGGEQGIGEEGKGGRENSD